MIWYILTHDQQFACLLGRNTLSVIFDDALLKFLVGSIIDSAFVSVVEPFEYVHKAKQVFFGNFVVIFEAVIALEDEATGFLALDVVKLFNFFDKVIFTNGLRVAEIEIGLVGEQLGKGVAKFGTVVALEVLAETVFVEARLGVLWNHLGEEVRDDILLLFVGEVYKFLLGFLGFLFLCVLGLNFFLFWRLVDLLDFHLLLASTLTLGGGASFELGLLFNEVVQIFIGVGSAEGLAQSFGLLASGVHDLTLLVCAIGIFWLTILALVLQ